MCLAGAKCELCCRRHRPEGALVILLAIPALAAFLNASTPTASAAHPPKAAKQAKMKRTRQAAWR